MVPVAVAGNILGEATTPSGNIFNEAMRGGEFGVAAGVIHPFRFRRYAPRRGHSCVEERKRSQSMN
jgi:hypothetical protein